MARATLPTLPFRTFLSYEQLTHFIEKLGAARPNLVRLDSLGPSRAGREVHLMTITDFGSGRPEDRPGYLIMANIHGGETAGTHMALHTARQLLADRPRSDLLERIVVYLIPRLNPDAAEFAVTTGGLIRSRIDTSTLEPNTLHQEDVNGDGLILSMRQAHPNGSFVADPKDRRLLIRRKADHRGPYYRVLPEGTIHAWDGTEEIRDGGRGFDWNRNWSYDWRPEPEQPGAGDFPFSEPEMQQLAQFIHRRPNLFGLLGYHTGPAAVLRAPSSGRDDQIDADDVQAMDELAAIGAQATGFPLVPAIKYHDRRRRDNNLRGHFHNFGYHHLGLMVFELELGTIYNSAGISTQDQFAVRTEHEAEALMRDVMKWWDRQKKRPPLFRPWKKFDHPQLGSVQIGGFPHVELSNPTLADLRKLAAGTYRFTIEHARRHPRVVLEDLTVDTIGESVYRIRCRVANRGQLATNVTNKGKGLSRLQQVRVELRSEDRAELLSYRSFFELGHLAGISGSQVVEWFVAAPDAGRDLGVIHVRAGTGGTSRHEVKAP